MPNISIKKILEWYAENKRVLPWRRDDISAYEVWVSEIMLQQTQVSRVILYYERFLKKFPTVQKLASSTWEEFLPYYEGLGYYARGRNMLLAAKIVVCGHKGEFPRDKKALMSLPGIGEYTASAILSFAYHEPEIAFDTNFKKLFETREIAEKIFRRSGISSAVFNSAVMDFVSARRRTGVVPPSGGLRIRKNAVNSNVADGGATPVRPTTVILHENHKKYFSENKKKYASFVMPKGVVSREAIKKHFLGKYNLRISVRPPNKKGVVAAQILLGTPHFAIYSKKDYDAYHDRAT